MTMPMTQGYQVAVTRSRPWTVVCGQPVAPMRDGQITMRDVRCCAYWSRETRTVLGLLSRGPDAQSRVSRAVEELTICGVELLGDVSAEALAAWRLEPWT